MNRPLNMGLTDPGEDPLWFDTAAKRQANGWILRGDFPGAPGFGGCGVDVEWALPTTTGSDTRRE